jgi:hypothetical protein
METRHDLRRQDRQPCDHSVTVRWRDLRGEEKFVRAKALDICKTGLRLQMPEALPRQSYVAISVVKLGLMGDASVRHCTRTGVSRFAVGVEFSAGLNWTPRASPDN